MIIWMSESDRELYLQALAVRWGARAPDTPTRADLYHSHPHLQRMESDNRSFFNSSLQTAHDLTHIALLPDGSVPSFPSSLTPCWTIDQPWPDLRQVKGQPCRLPYRSEIPVLAESAHQTSAVECPPAEPEVAANPHQI